MMFLKKHSAGVAESELPSGPRELQQRARRFPLAAPIRFRHVGHLGWRSGRTVNLSRSGVLFESEAPVAAGTVVEMAISLPERGSEAGKTMVATAIIVRHLVVAGQPGAPALAARIVNYSL